MLDDLRVLVGALAIAGVAFGIYMIIHRHAARNSDVRLRLHQGDPDNRWIDEEDKVCRAHAVNFMEVDAEGAYLLKRDAFDSTDLNEIIVFRDRIERLLKVVEDRLGRIPGRAYFDKEAWQQVKEDRANWQDTAHFCRKAHIRLAPGQHPQFRVNR